MHDRLSHLLSIASPNKLMFQTDIHHFLQSFSNDFLDFLMQIITALGYQEFLMVLIAFLIFGIHFKKGFLVLQLLLWTGILTFFFKGYFALPRPFHVDSTLQLLEGLNHGISAIPFSKQGAATFFGLPPFEVISYYRDLGEFSYGFPSGHTSVAVTVWGGMAILFRKKWLTYLSIAMILLIPFSRLYLGVHFIADILGGYALGGIILFLFYHLVLKTPKLHAFLEKYTFHLDSKSLTFIFIPLVLIPFLPMTAAVIPAFMIGFNLVFYWLSRNGLPVNVPTWQAMLGSSILFLILLGGFVEGSQFLIDSVNIEMSKVLYFFQYFISVSLAILLTVNLSYRFNWLEKSIYAQDSTSVNASLTNL